LTVNTKLNFSTLNFKQLQYSLAGRKKIKVKSYECNGETEKAT